jgi:hypothetical protein
MSRTSTFKYVLILLASLPLKSLLIGASPRIGQEPTNSREALYRPNQETKVIVLLHNYAHLPAQILLEAQDRAGHIFRKAGVEIEWADCPLNDEDPSLYPKCATISDTTQLFLRILPDTTAKIEEGGQAFFAARIANVFWNRLEKQAQKLQVSASRFLAHIIAHELGHLLLGSNSHSHVGIMTAQWDALTVTRISQEGLYFSSQQSELIRSEIGKRKALAVAHTVLARQR